MAMGDSVGLYGASVATDGDPLVVELVTDQRPRTRMGRQIRLWSLLTHPIFAPFLIPCEMILTPSRAPGDDIQTSQSLTATARLNILILPFEYILKRRHELMNLESIKG